VPGHCAAISSQQRFRRRETIWVDMPGRSHVKLWMQDEALVILGVWAMRHLLFLLGLVLFVTGASSAQSSSTNPLLLAAPFSLSSSGAVSAAAASPSSTSYSPSLASLATSPSETVANPFSSAPATNASPDPQYVQGVFVNYNWQAYVGYTYTHFGAQHGISRNLNGFNLDIAYYFKSWFGIEGEMFATHDSPNNQSSWFVFVGGGPRFRWQARKGIEVFAHGLVGYSHLTPQTPFGSQAAFGYEVGGGADFPTPFRRLALRAGADMIATRYFNDNQFNPKAYGGVVFKF
jgi:hypothetical protein